MVDFTEEDYIDLEKLREEQKPNEWEPIPLYLELPLSYEENKPQEPQPDIVIIQL